MAKKKAASKKAKKVVAKKVTKKVVKKVAKKATKKASAKKVVAKKKATAKKVTKKVAKKETKKASQAKATPKAKKVEKKVAKKVEKKAAVDTVATPPALPEVKPIAQNDFLNLKMAKLNHEDPREHKDDAAIPEHPPIMPIVREEPKIGRNEPCHCGSGIKYKKCHGKA